MKLVEKKTSLMESEAKKDTFDLARMKSELVSDMREKVAAIQTKFNEKLR